MALSRPKLSVIMITKNAERTIKNVLESVTWADEIVILDSGSTDNTLAICRQYTDNITETDWPGFGQQKQRALAKASHEWILAIDADEVVTPELSQTIQQVICDDAYAGYTICRPLVFANQICRHGIGALYVLRLFKKSVSHYTDDAVHEKVITQGKIGKLHQSLLHYSYANYSDWLQRMDHYTTLSAKMKQQQAKKSSVFKAIISSNWCFWKMYLFKGGFLDGRAGLLIAINWAIGNYIKYTKLAIDYDQPSSANNT